MAKIIPIKNVMSRSEKMKARAHNRQIAYAEIEQHYKNNPVQELSREDKKEARKHIKQILAQL